MNRSPAFVCRTAAVLRQLAEHPDEGITVRHLTTVLHLPTRTTRTLLGGLREEGLVRRDPGTDVFHLAGPLRSARADRGPLPDCNALRSAAMPWADTLAARSGMSVQLAVAHPEGVQIVHHVFRPDNSPQRLATGEIRPATSALARALDAPCDGRCVYAADTGEPGTGSLATAVTCPGPVSYAAALSLTGPAHALDPAGGAAAARATELLRDAARAITSALETAPAR
ncbi:helix-turn-helix domain-containing protein [Streptomyces stramineus]|uniref:HTH iclR-type domain-containing protein n=1 Tax=Streptomyces stramineus TaxID=173861 RepID=A0ABN1ALM9_9ACTN